MKLVAISGGIASGKSVISRYLRNLGYTVIDSDEIGHAILEREDVKKEIAEKFGNVLDSLGNVDRKKLGSIVFADKAKLDVLNLITHKKIIHEILDQAKELEAANDVVFVEVAVLFEGGFDRYFDFIIVADCPDDKRVQRIILRDHLSYDESLKRIHSQMPRSEYLKKADFVIDTSSDTEKTFEELFDMLEKKPWSAKI